MKHNLDITVLGDVYDRVDVPKEKKSMSSKEHICERVHEVPADVVGCRVKPLDDLKLSTTTCRSHSLLS